MGRLGKFLKNLFTSEGTISGGPTQPQTPGASMVFKEGWVPPAKAGEPINPEATPPKIKLRYNIHKSVIDTFLTLAVSTDGSDASGSGYDVLVGGVGAGLPESFLNIGVPKVSALTVLGNSSILKELAQTHNPVHTYPFDLASPVAFKDFLANECLATQLMLGPLQNGKLTLKGWVHEESSTVTLNAVNGLVVNPIRLPSLKRLNMTFGFNPVDLSPQFARAFRWLGVSNVKPEQSQDIRLYIDGVTANKTTASSPWMEKLIRVYYRMFGGAPFVYPVSVSMEDYMSAGLEFGDSVAWSDPNVVTPSGIGISGDFFIVGVDLQYEGGQVNLLLLENKLTSASQGQQQGAIAPAWSVDRVSEISTTDLFLDLKLIGSSAVPDPDGDFDGLLGQMIDAGKWLQVDNYGQSPSGDKEQLGSILAHCQLKLDNTVRYKTIGSRLRVRVTVPAAYHRGEITRASDLFIPGETQVSLPVLQTAGQNVNSTLIEPLGTALPINQGFINLQPPRAYFGSNFTFGT
jgi:hypothetical protein